MQESIIIPARFRGPPESGNGGYVAGAIAECFADTQPSEADAAIEVTLRAPTPLDRSMTVSRPDDDSLQLILGETLIAEACRTRLELDVPEPPSFAAALAAQPQSASFFEHINPLLPEGRGDVAHGFCHMAPSRGHTDHDDIGIAALGYGASLGDSAALPHAHGLPAVDDLGDSSHRHITWFPG